MLATSVNEIFDFISVLTTDLSGMRRAMRLAQFSADLIRYGAIPCFSGCRPED